jgi:hypothetical protein
LGKQCAECHTTSSWIVSTISDIHQRNGFPLKGMHKSLECIECHKSGSKLRFEPLSTTCVGCHLKDYAATTNPAHAAAKFSRACEICHDEMDWNNATFNHTSATGFPLNGAHKPLQCIQCHTQGYEGTNTACVSCHLKDYTATTNPAHATAKFPTTCEMCHDEVDWNNATFDHNTSTSFPLRGAHQPLECTQCHTQGYAGTNKACVACHLKDYTATTNPAHTAAKFTTTCETCHDEVDWNNGKFEHNTATSFPLNGAHKPLQCNQCHTQGYEGTNTACVSCHLDDYSATTNPAHATARFPTTCQSCHTETAWTPTTFNHDVANFPIYSGKHRGKWSTCTQCHINASNFSVFSCLTCHEHNKSSMDEKHHEVGGYSYNSNSCLNCHPTGNSD